MEKDTRISKTTREYYQKGVNALKKNNYDYAIEMLLQVVQEEPLFHEARHELHRAEYEKYSSQPPSLVSLLLIKINNLIPLIMAVYYESLKQHDKAIAFYEDLLRYDLCNSRYLNKIYNLARKAEYTDIAIIALESMYRLDKNSSEIAQNLGRLYRDSGNIQKATFFFKRAIELDPHNQKLTKSFKDLEALHTIQSGGWDKKDSYRSKLKDEETTQSLEKRNRLIDQTGVSKEELKEKEDALAAGIENVANWIALIDFCIESDLLKMAHEKIADAQKRFPTDQDIKERVNAYNQRYYAASIQKTKAALKESPGDTALQEEIRTHERNLAKTNITILSGKTKLYPNDLGLKYELGLAYFDLGSFDEAIGEFQQAVKDPALSVRALNKLGAAFGAKKMHDLAVVQFNKALEKVPGINETSKDIIYNLGKSLEAMGKRDEALTQYKKIYEADISYRDIAKKIDEFYRS